ncbi:MAG: ComEC/Rec2 family competence protein, partial [Pseudomonadota bacterium]
IVVLFALGFGAAGLRSHSKIAPVLKYRTYGPVEGRVVGLDRSASGALRVTLDHARLGRMSLHDTPRTVRLSLFGPDADSRPEAGAWVMTTAHLSPPNGPAEPRGFDFRRHAWFAQLGAVGYTRLPLLLSRAEADPPLFLALRLSLSDRVREHLPGQTGAFAAALMTGDRSALSLDTLRALRQTNLAHLLAISGLHMGLLAGVVFGALRLLLVMLPISWQGTRTKKIAALGALSAAALYLGLSGGSVATERAFVMAAVALGAIALDRRAISLRAVALAAMIVMLRQPEALLGPGFQMSFAATTALVVVFRLLSDRVPSQTARHWLWRVATGVVVSSAVAGLATLPIAAAHFNQIAHFGLLANIVSVPLMGIWIMPLAVLAVCLIPLGLEMFPLMAMGWGLDWILEVAHSISGWEGAVRKVPSPPGHAFFMLCFGLVVLAACATHLRWAGAALACAGLAFWSLHQRPDLLIAADGSLIGVQTPAGRAVSKAKGAGFVARIWLENDGDVSSQQEAAQRWQEAGMYWGFGQQPYGQIIAVKGKRGLGRFTGCGSRDIVVFSEKAPGTELPCLVFDKTSLRRSGAVAIHNLENGRRKIETAREIAGRRLWTSPETRRIRARQMGWLFGGQ